MYLRCEICAGNVPTPLYFAGNVCDMDMCVGLCQKCFTFLAMDSSLLMVI